MAGQLLPDLAAAYAGPRVFVERLADTLRRLGERHVADRDAPFDVQLTHQAYIDIDNILQELLRERQQYPLAFDEAFAGVDRDVDGPEDVTVRSWAGGWSRGGHAGRASRARTCERLVADAGVAKLADARDLKSRAPEGACGFDPHPRQSLRGQWVHTGP